MRPGMGSRARGRLCKRAYVARHRRRARRACRLRVRRVRVACRPLVPRGPVQARRIACLRSEHAQHRTRLTMSRRRMLCRACGDGSGATPSQVLTDPQPTALAAALSRCLRVHRPVRRPVGPAPTRGYLRLTTGVACAAGLRPTRSPAGRGRLRCVRMCLRSSRRRSARRVRARPSPFGAARRRRCGVAPPALRGP